MKLALILLILIPTITFAFPTKPNVFGSYCSVEDPDFKEYRYVEQIPVCNRNVTTARKDKICAKVGIYNRRDFTIDHLIPLSMGGSNHDDNLWCQHKSIAVTSDEYSTYVELKEGQISAQEAVQRILNLKFAPRS